MLLTQQVRWRAVRYSKVYPCHLQVEECSWERATLMPPTLSGFVLSDPATVAISSQQKGMRAVVWVQTPSVCLWQGCRQQGTSEFMVHGCEVAVSSSITFEGDVGRVPLWGCLSVVQKSREKVIQKRLLQQGDNKIPMTEGRMWRCFMKSEEGRKKKSVEPNSLSGKGQLFNWLSNHNLGNVKKTGISMSVSTDRH